MRLVDREPEFIKAHGTDVRCYLSFRCPCSAECVERITVPFAPSLDGQPLPEFITSKAWVRSGGPDFDTLTLSPSIWLHASEHDGHAGWHGFLRNGNLETC